MAMKEVNTTSQVDITVQLKQLKDLVGAERQAEQELLDFQLQNAQTLYNQKVKNITNLKKMGLDSEEKLAEEIKALDDKLKKKNLSADEKIELEAEKKKLEKKQELAKKYSKKWKKEQEAEKLKEAREEAKKLGLKKDEYWKYVAETTGMSEEDAKKQSRGQGLINATDKLLKGLSDFAKQLDNTIDEIGSFKGIIDTRLQGSTKNWTDINKTITSIAATSPYVKQQDINNKIKEMVSSGINYNVEQRAFLSVISEKIASTFDANNSSLAKLIRIQQQDSTAARLGMESAMTAFLNNMYETTEYLSDVANEVRQNLYEAEALMGTEQAVEFDYQVQKWLGSLYSVGFNSTSSLSQTLGQLASGQIASITGGGTGNLVVMAANNAGLSIADMLANGLDESSTNKLMQAMVDYLSGIYESTEGNRLLQQQMAGVYGLTASDLKAAANLSSSVGTVSKQGLSYGGAMNQLYNMTGTIGSRTSVGEKLSNMWSNIQYSMAAGIANSPALYGIYKAAGLLDNIGGIALPSIAGNSLNTTVADLMRVGALGGGILSNMGNLVSGIGNSFSGTKMLDALKINGGSVVSRGNGAGLLNTGVKTTSESGYIGNSNSSDIRNKTVTDANDDLNTQIKAQEDDSTTVTNKTIDTHIVEIYKLLEAVVDGSKTLAVQVQNYGLTGWN